VIRSCASPVPTGLRKKAASDLPITPAHALGQEPTLVGTGLGGNQLRVVQQQPLQPDLPEVNLHARLRAASFGPDDDAGAESRMDYVLPDTPRAAGHFMRHDPQRFAGNRGMVNRGTLLEGTADLPHQLLRDFPEKSRSDPV